MAGLVDILSGNFQPQPYGGLLYPSPVKTEAELAQEAREMAAARLAGGARRSPEIAASPFGPVPAAPEAPAALPPLAPGAVPFSFAGPGSLNVPPSQPAAAAAPAAAGAPAMPAAPAAAPLASAAPGGPVPPASPLAAAAPATDISSVNRAAPAAAGATPPAAPAAAPASPFGFGRLSTVLQSVQGSKGLIPSLVNATEAAVTGERSDPAGRAGNATAKALIAKGASPEDVAAAQTIPGGHATAYQFDLRAEASTAAR